MSFDISNYVDVATRLVEFREKHPAGSLQPAIKSKPYSIETINDRVFIVVVAAAYRTPDDPTPGIGMAYEPFPGKTPYTKDSELQNAETSAWGRAIMAALAADSRKGIASADELRNRRADDAEVVEDPNERKSLWEEAVAIGAVKGKDAATMQAAFLAGYKVPVMTASINQLKDFIERTKTLPDDGHVVLTGPAQPPLEES